MAPTHKPSPPPKRSPDKTNTKSPVKKRLPVNKTALAYVLRRDKVRTLPGPINDLNAHIKAGVEGVFMAKQNETLSDEILKDISKKVTKNSGALLCALLKNINLRSLAIRHIIAQELWTTVFRPLALELESIEPLIDSLEGLLNPLARQTESIRPALEGIVTRAVDLAKTVAEAYKGHEPYEWYMPGASSAVDLGYMKGDRELPEGPDETVLLGIFPGVWEGSTRECLVAAVVEVQSVLFL
jgi:hypothetical protein